MKAVCSLPVDAASAVADISALIWRISRSSVDGCMTFSFDRGLGQLIPDFVHRKSASHMNRRSGCDTLLSRHQALVTG